MKNKNINNSTLIIDGTFCLYRSYYAFPLLKNKKNDHCGAIYGFLNTLKKLKNTIFPKKIIIAFDSEKKNFRHKIFLQYKQNRKMIPDILKQQIHPLQKIIEYMGILIIMIPKIEADDIIGSIVNTLKKKNTKKIFIFTNDKDIAQLVNQHIFIINSKFQILDRNAIKKKYGIIPKCIPDFLALTGDTSDNIPGVYGIGKKTAIILINKFKYIKNIYKKNNLIKIKEIRNGNNIFKKLTKNKKQAFLSLKLTTIQKNLITMEKIKYFKKNTFNEKKLLFFFQYYQFKKWTKYIQEKIKKNKKQEIMKLTY